MVELTSALKLYAAEIGRGSGSGKPGVGKWAALPFLAAHWTVPNADTALFYGNHISHLHTREQ